MRTNIKLNPHDPSPNTDDKFEKTLALLYLKLTDKPRALMFYDRYYSKRQRNDELIEDQTYIQLLETAGRLSQVRRIRSAASITGLCSALRWPGNARRMVEIFEADPSVEELLPDYARQSLLRERKRLNVDGKL